MQTPRAGEKNNMEIKYKKLSKRFPAAELKRFFDESTPGKTTVQCRNIIKFSSIIIGAFDGDKLVGIARSLDDTVYAFIEDVLVSPKYRKRGVGTKIVRLLCKELIRKKIAIISCDTTKKLIPFYKSATKKFIYNPNNVALYIKNL